MFNRMISSIKRRGHREKIVLLDIKGVMRLFLVHVLDVNFSKVSAPLLTSD